MHDEYLWDRSGPVDADVAALERALMPLRFEPESPRLCGVESSPRSASRNRGVAWALPVVAMAAAVALVVSLWPRLEDDEHRGQALTTAERDEGGASENESAGAPKNALDRPSVQVSSLDEHGLGQTDGVGVAAPPKAAGSATKAPRKTQGVRRKPKRPPREKNGGSDDSETVSLDCVLDPSKCGEPRPRTLTQTDIRSGIKPLKRRAAECGQEHGATPGTKVKVKMNIEGSTGRVTSSAAQSPWAGTGLGRCVAKVLENARFPRFEKESLGVLYPIIVDGQADPERRPRASKDTNVVREAQLEMRTKARACAVAHDVVPGTRVEVRLDIARDGVATSVEVIAKDALSADARRCLSLALGKIRFGNPGQRIRARVPLSL